VRRLPIDVATAAVALVALAVLGTVTGSTAARVVPPKLATAAVTSTTLVCPDINGVPVSTSSTAVASDVAAALSPPSQSSGTVSATILAGRRSTKTALTLAPGAAVPSRPKLNHTIAIQASGSVAASLVANQVSLTTSGRYRGLSGVSCVAPATDWWFAGPDGRVGFTDVLTLANPASTPADLSISLFGVKGPLPSPTLQSVRVRPRSAIHIAIASVAPDDPTIAVHVHTFSGAVTAALIDRRTSGLLSDGADYLPATQAPARAAVVAGFAPGVGPRRLILADPGTLAATVDLKLVTTSGSFVPVGDNELVVRAGHTREVNLDRAFSGSTGAVELTSDQPVIAAGLSVATTTSPNRPDLMWLAATPPLVGSAGFAIGRELTGGRCYLLLSAPQGAAQVRVSTPAGGSQVISVPAGSSVTADITATIQPKAGEPGAGTWPFVVTSVGSAPVYGVRVLRFAGALGPLITDAPLLALPTPIVLPAVRSDPNIATR
jgi:hypothetical protein